MYTIYTRWLAAELRNRGFDIIKVQANPNKPEFDCYLFEDTEAFQKALDEINKSRRRV